LGLLALGVLAVPLAAHGASERALVPTELLAEADAHPEQVFSVIVQGRGKARSADVATDVAEEREAAPGKGKGVHKRFATISGVAADLTGRQISRLAARNDILAITRDALVAASGGMLPPSPLAPPTIDGIAQVGQSLTASDGVWSGSDPITYVQRWQRCDALGSVCVDIEGAAGAVYTIASADVGFTLRIAITATNAVGTETAISDPTAVVVAAPVGPLPPVSLSPPAIAGTATEGQTLTASEGTWGGSFPVAYAYQWQRCDATGAGCVGAAGATGASYVLTPSDVGATLRVVVTATDGGGSTSATSLQSGVVAAAPRPPAPSAPPAVSGEARDGATLTGAPGVWVASGAFSQTYAWERCGAAYDQAVLADLPAGYWRLDNGPADASGHGLNGVIAGTASQVDGATASSPALVFGANSGIDVPNATIGAAFTLEAWVRLGRAQQDKGLLGRWRYADGGGALLWIDPEGHYGLAVGRQPSTYLATTVTPQPGRWEHVVGTWDGTVLRVFVNGVEAGSKPFAGDIGSTLRDFEIGKYGDPTQHLEGAVDEAALYSRALDTADVGRHYAAGCHPIAGATGATYSVGAADLGSRLRVRVTAANEAGSGTAVSDATALVLGAAPVSASAPALSGSALETQTLTASPGTWAGTQPIAFSYRWQRCDAAGGACVEIVGAVGATYTLSAADVGARVRAVVSATNASGSGEASSDVTALVLAAAPAVTATPSVSGLMEAGSTLTASAGTWNGVQPIAFSFRWQRCDTGGVCIDIAGATSATYTLTAADVGASAKVVVSATNASGSSEAASDATAAITGVAPASASAPQLSGSAMETETLTASPGTWSGTQPIEHAYRWQRCDGAGACVEIAGATGATYTLTAADVGARVKVVVSATNVSGSSEAASAPTAHVLAAAPVSLSAPQVSGTAVDLQTLTATSGTWTGVQPIALSYRWQRCDGAGTCVEILGAVGSTYMLSAADVGARMKVVVTATNRSGSSEAASDPTAPVLGAAPVSVSAPQVSGSPVETQALTASSGTWSGTQPIEHAYRWQRCDGAGACVDLAGATSATYTLTAADVGATVKVVVSATNVAGSSEAASEVTAQVLAAVPVATAPPGVSGVAEDGRTLTASPGTWTGLQPIDHSFRWQRCDGASACADVAGATGATYALTAADVGAALKVVVTATNAAGSREAASELTAAVLGVAPVLVSAPQISGTATETQTLTASAGTWNGTQPIAHAFRWQRCDTAGACTDIPGATGATYTLSVAEVGARVKAVVSATNVSGATDVASEATAVVSAAAPVSVSAPQVSGAAIELQTLTASPGTWSGIEPIVFTYRWQRCDSPGGPCVEIVGALGATYLLSAEDVGSRLRVVVSATNAAGSSEASSDKTAQVGGVAPASVSAPQLSGTAIETQTLTASTGTWNGTQPIQHSYRWQRCDTAGACVDIAGATESTYRLTAPDVGGKVKVVVSATNMAGSAQAASEATAQVLGAAPVSSSAPSVTGAALETQTLSASAGTWSGLEPIAFSYRWQRCDTAGACVDIATATGATYTLTTADVGAKVKVVVSATNAAGSSEAASDATALVLAAAPVAKSPPSLSGVAEDGGTLVAATGVWDGLDATLAVRWERCDSTGATCSAIAGAESASYVLAEPDVGATVRAVVTATNAAGSASATSAPSPVVADSFSALQQWPSVVGAEASWASAKANVAVPTIAFVDSGIEAGRADFGGRVVHEETLTTLTPNSPGDGRGHGTLVASIAAGEGAGYAGVVPGAKLVSIDVLDDSGRARTSDVIAAADWIYRNKDAYGIRVANFSLHATTPTSFRVDPLNRAVQKLWFSGVVVIAASGNYAVDGAKSGVPFPPGNDPFIITAGAVDTAGTIDQADDVTAPWSAWGFTPDGFAKPDVSAPGRYMVGAVPENSTLVAERPGNVVSPGYMQLSGTSFAAPVVAGAAAYLLGAHPTWTPDQVKGALMHESTTLPTATKNSFGIGEINVARAASTESPPNPNLALNQFLITDPAGGPEPVFDDAGWTAIAQSDEAWGAEAWGAEAWGAEAWGAEAWGAEAWGASYWEPVPSWTAPTTEGSADGTATSALNNASADWLPAGAYWLTRP
jgi:subtilisin family serine protease